MASLVSLNEEYILQLKPYGFEGKKEDWVLTELIIQHNKNIILRSSGAFLQISDLNSIIEGIKNITSRLIDNFKLDPLEPNFEFSIHFIEGQKYLVKVTFFEKIEYEAGKIKKAYNASNSMTMEINKQNLTSFSELLNSEVKHLMKQRR